MSELSRDEKIRKIQELIGVPPCDYEVTKPNLARLSDEDLDNKLKKLEAGAARVDEWRKSRGPAAFRSIPTVRDLLEPL